MYLLTRSHGKFSELDEKARQITARIFASIPAGKPLELPAQSCVNDFFQESGAILLLKEGVIVASSGPERLFVFEEGDVAGTEFLAGMPAISLTTEFAVTAVLYKISDLLKQLAQTGCALDDWQQLCSIRSLQYMELYSSSVVSSPAHSPRLKRYEKGDTIIQEGDRAEEVFNLVQGHADVYVSGKRVGEILCDELFGALAALSGTPRTASVIATEPCMAMVMPAQEFSTLITQRPELAAQLARDMSRLIVDLNSKIASLTGAEKVIEDKSR